MITDRIQLAGLDAYFRDPNNPSIVNLAPIAPVTVRTFPLNKGQQLEISGLRFLIENGDLSPLFRFQSQSSIFRVSVMKEMFPGLFADPYIHRVHNIAGSLDFNQGTLSNGRISEVDGISTICSTGREDCKWVSVEYLLPDPVTIDSAAWELATSKLTLPDSFKYKIEIECKDAGGSVIDSIRNGPNFAKADKPRFKKKVVHNVSSFQITFIAKVSQDSFLSERNLPAPNEKAGRPLLRAVNVLELLSSSLYDIHSLNELQALCSDCYLFENPGAAIPRLTATLDFSVTLVNSPNQNINNNNIYDSASTFEYVELKVLSDQFTTIEVKRMGDALTRI
jgi:hypothetical protein